MVNLTSLEISRGGSTGSAVLRLRNLAHMAVMPSLQQFYIDSFCAEATKVVAVQHLPLTYIYVSYKVPAELEHVGRWLRGGGGRALQTLSLVSRINSAPLLATREPHEEMAAVLSLLGSPGCAPHLGKLYLHKVRMPSTAISKLECLPKATSVFLVYCDLVDDATASCLSALENVRLLPQAV